jgi:Rrf2 family protein
MFSQTVEYALRAMTQMAIESPGPSTTAGIAEQAKVPAAYLAKIMQEMRRGGLIKSRRGVNGGVWLARPANRITLLDVVEAVQPPHDNGNGKGAKSLATLNQKLDGFAAQLKKSCKSTTLADVAKRGAKK